MRRVGAIPAPYSIDRRGRGTIWQGPWYHKTARSVTPLVPAELEQIWTRWEPEGQIASRFGADWGRIGSRFGADWGQIGSRLGPDWKQIRSRLRADWGQTVGILVPGCKQTDSSLGPLSEPFHNLNLGLQWLQEASRYVTSP